MRREAKIIMGLFIRWMFCPDSDLASGLGIEIEKIRCRAKNYRVIFPVPVPEYLEDGIGADHGKSGPSTNGFRIVNSSGIALSILQLRC